MRSSYLPLLIALGCSVGCSRSGGEGTWPTWLPSLTNPQAINNLAQVGLTQSDTGDHIYNSAHKLVYHAEADLLVQDLSEAQQEIDKTLKANDGIVANAEISGQAGAPRSGLLRLRVPTDKFETFFKTVLFLGEIQRSQQVVQDVTRNHSEIEEQIKNLATEVEGLRVLLARPGEKLTDSLAVREHLAKVTNEREALRSRLMRMQAEAEYSTVILRLRERKDFVSDAAPGFLGTVNRAFWDSVDVLLICTRKAAVAMAMAVPWLPLIGIVAFLSRLALRRWRNRRIIATSGSAI
jgi:hypothetical protein